jgi:hypothetical protein
MSDDDPSLLSQPAQSKPIGGIYPLLKREPGDRSIHGSGIYVEIA